MNVPRLSAFVNVVIGKHSDTARFLRIYPIRAKIFSTKFPQNLVERTSSPEKNLSAAIKNRTLCFQCLAFFC
jgi:hypothetical protein